MENEIWLSIVGYPDYEVSNLGRVRSYKNGKELVCKFDWSGRERKKYLSVRLYNTDGRKKFLVHKLVWEVFNGPIPEEHQVDHIDRNNLNNNLYNLRCVTISENQLNKGEPDIMTYDNFFEC